MSELDHVGDSTLVYQTFCFRGGASGGSAQGMAVEFTTGDSPRFDANAFSASGNQAGGTASMLSASIDFLGIAEFVDDGDGAFDPEKDQIIDQHGFSGPAWGAIEATEAGGVQFEATYQMSPGTFTIRGHAAAAASTQGGVRVTPLDTKIDFLFSGYQYGHPESQLGLMMLVSTEATQASGSAGSMKQSSPVVQSSERGVVHTSGASHMYFTWAKTATVDGQEMPVGSHVETLSGESTEASSSGGSAQFYENQAAVTFAYARGDEIVHDPRLGVQFDVKKESPGPAIAFVVIAVAAVAIKRR